MFISRASTCYLPDPRLCYRNVAKVLRPGGLYFSEHWNPAQMQLGTGHSWDGEGYRIIHPSGTGQALLMGGTSAAEGAETMFVHRLRDLLGGICDAGFVIERLGERGSSDLAAEAGSEAHLGAYLEPFHVVLARRLGRPVTGNQLHKAAGQDNAPGVGPVPQGPPAVRGLRPLPKRLAERRHLPEHWRRHGFVTLRHVLEPGRLLPALHRESLSQRAMIEKTTCSEYGIAEDESYVSGGMSFTSAHPGSVLSWLSHHPDLLSLVRWTTGNKQLEASGDGAYMYYDGTSFIDVHTDVPECQATVLTSVVGQVPPLIAYPRLRGIGLPQLLDVANSTAGRPAGGVLIEVPVGGLLILDGRALPHRRPPVPPVKGRSGSRRCASPGPPHERVSPVTWQHPRISLFIATAPRSGSWLLAEGLRGLAMAGSPEEYFRADLEEYYRHQWGLAESAPYRTFLNRVILAGTTANGVFAVKVHWFQFQHMFRRLRSLDPADPVSDAELLERYFGPVQMVYLERRDVVRQAISWLRAIRTDEWWLMEPDLPGQPLLPGEYDFECIKHLFYLLQDYRTYWRRWFSDNGIHPLELNYEDIAADYPASLLSILRHLGVSAAAKIPAPLLQRQADQHSELWARAFWQSWMSLFGPAELAC